MLTKGTKVVIHPMAAPRYDGTVGYVEQVVLRRIPRFLVFTAVGHFSLTEDELEVVDESTPDSE